MFEVQIQNYDKHDFNKTEYTLLKTYYTILSSVLDKLSNIIIFTKPKQKLYNLHVKYWRKRAILDIIYINQTADYYYCNICHKLVFKGHVGKGIVMYCPNCHSIFNVCRDSDGKLVQSTKEAKYDKFTEDTFIDNHVRYNETIEGIEYNVVDR